MRLLSDDLVASGYDAVYAAVVGSATFGRLWREHACGPDYPAEFAHISFLTVAEHADLAARLAVGEGATLVDLACGAGGPGVWIASSSGARLVGIDLSAVGLAHARRRAAHHGVPGVFAAGSFGALPVRAGGADAAMSVDALQYAPDKAAAVDEAARALRPGGVFAFTVFEVDADRVAGLPVLGDDPVDDYRPLLEAAGFDVEAYEETPGWHDRLVAAYSAVTGAHEGLTDELGVPAFTSLALEMTLTLDRDPYPRRVMAAARRR